MKPQQGSQYTTFTGAGFAVKNSFFPGKESKADVS
jgi:hypothetical protein